VVEGILRGGEWNRSKPEPDKVGLDMFVNLLEDRQPQIGFFLQIKGIARKTRNGKKQSLVSRAGTLDKPIELERLDYYMKLPVPVFLVVVDVVARVGYYVHLQRYVTEKLKGENWRERLGAFQQACDQKLRKAKPTKTIRVPVCDVLLERVFELVFRRSEPPEHYMTHGDIDHRLAQCGITLVVLAVPPISPDPGKGPLHDPTLGQHHETFDLCWSEHGLEQPSEGVFHTSGQVVSAISAVGKDYLQSVKSCFQLAENSQDQQSSFVVLNICRMDRNCQNRPQRVDNDMALSTVDLLTCVVTTLATDLGCLDGLTVDDRRAGRLLAPYAAPEHLPERVVNPLPGSIIASTEKEPVNGLPIGKVAGQMSPGATAALKVEDGVEDGAAADRLRSAAARRLWQKFSKDLPLLVGKVRGIFRLFRVGHRYDSFRSVTGNRRMSYRFSLI
jgi:Domain of unknown function (DUF4365)